jgi:hypothetical protein
MAKVDQVDLVIMRASRVVIPHPMISIHALPLPWLKAENANGAEIFIRPARNRKWPLVFLDDVKPGLAYRIAQKYAALAVHTSTAGGCHIWIRTARFLDECERGQAQRWLAQRVGADQASTSGEHLGRLAGMRNWKRQGVWVNIIVPELPGRRSWDPAPAFQPTDRCEKNVRQHCSYHETQRTAPRTPDQSESGKEWGWVCGMLENGIEQEVVYQRLYQRSIVRRGTDAERYARHTIERAVNR